MDDLIKGYEEGRHALQLISNAMPALEAGAVRGKRIVESKRNDKGTLITGMISDMTYAIEWMRTGREPGRKRGIERQGVYNNTVLIEPNVLDSLDMSSVTLIERSLVRSRLSAHEEDIIHFFNHMLSEREKDCYILVRANELSFEEVAVSLHISKSSVQSYVERAEQKIEESFINNLFFYSC
ncbi:hypothetical protein EP56_05695 [Listeriaceae bacterium FSL A5-0209]|nr:hypothetical protein EP56_05695 [Listeriaceae bacterium FSL A5-0209]